MTKDEMKNRISMALKDPILQQGFECICKNLAELEEENAELKEQNYKTKVALRNVIDYLGQFCSDYPDCVIEAEQFLKEVETTDIREDSTLDGDWVVDEH